MKTLFILFLIFSFSFLGFSQNEVNKNGLYQDYYVNNQLKIEGQHLRGNRHGTWKFYYSDGVLKSTIDYTRGLMNGKFLLFWENGTLKREDIYKHGNFIKGTCYDNQGNRIEYFYYEIMPKYMDGKYKYSEFLSENIKYPVPCRRDGLTGTVYVQCVIDKEGNLISTKTLNKSHELFEIEALRVVNLMKKWTPGKRDGEEVEMTINLPIKFSLTEPYH
jgi:TonB family protein